MFAPSSLTEADIIRLSEVLAATPIGEICRYADLSKAIGRNIQENRTLAIRAMGRLNKETGALFACVWKTGYRRLPADDAHTVGANRRAHIRRSARRTSKQISRALECANDISDAAKRRAVGELASMNLIAHLSSEKHARSQDRPDKPPPIAETLKLMMQHFGIVKSG